MSNQPEALRLGALLDYEAESPFLAVKYSTAKQAAAELRRLHQVELQRDELLEALEVLFTNIDHAISCGAWKVQEGSQTWEAIEDVKARAAINKVKGQS